VAAHMAMFVLSWPIFGSQIIRRKIIEISTISEEKAIEREETHKCKWQKISTVQILGLARVSLSD